MKIYNGFNDKRIHRKRRSVAIGVFDGVHLGHQEILRRLRKNSSRTRTGSMVITFEPHPAKLLKPDNAQPVLMSLSHRLRSFKSLGAKEVLIIHFDRRFAKITCREFVERLLIRKLGMVSLAVGEDFRFGYKGQGDADFLNREARRLGFKLSLVRPLAYLGQAISSTRIRGLIKSGALDKAAKMLGRPVSAFGTVVRGRGRGRSLGFPTANLDPHHETLPPNGVYAAWGLVAGRRLKGVVHIGARPTFKERDKSLEVHFLSFSGSLYGEEIELLFVSRLRGIRRFADRAMLIKAIQKDAQKALQVL